MKLRNGNMDGSSGLCSAIRYDCNIRSHFLCFANTDILPLVLTCCNEDFRNFELPEIAYPVISVR
jgi:hypothetical protein